MEALDLNNHKFDILSIKEFIGSDPVFLKKVLEKFLVTSRKTFFGLRKSLENSEDEKSLFLLRKLSSIYSVFHSTDLISIFNSMEMKLLTTKNSNAVIIDLNFYSKLISKIDKDVLAYINDEQFKANKNILLIEDDEMMSTMISLKLRKENYNVDVAQNGLDGLEMLTQKVYNLVITDIKMPFVSGADVVSYVKNKLNYKTNVIATSIRRDDPEVIKSISLGADHFIQKPLSLNELILNVEKYIV